MIRAIMSGLRLWMWAVNNRQTEYDLIKTLRSTECTTNIINSAIEYVLCKSTDHQTPNRHRLPQSPDPIPVGAYVIVERRVFVSRIVIKSPIFLCNYSGVVFAESSIAATTGGTVSIWCDTKANTSVIWQYQRELTSEDEYICFGGQITPSFSRRFQLILISNGRYALSIYNVTLNDTGIYTCIAEDGFGTRHYARLTTREPRKP